MTPQRSLLWKCLQIEARIFSSVWFNLHTIGRHHIPKTGGVILAANHQSYLDPVLVSVHLNRPVCFMAKSELFSNRAFAWLIRSLCAYPVRQNENDIAAVRETIRLLQAGNIVNIYPEGTRTVTGEVGSIEKGIALVIRKARVPVVPVAIHGSFQAWPRTERIFHAHPIRVMYGPPMDLCDMPGSQIVTSLGSVLQTMLGQLREGDRQTVKGAAGSPRRSAG